MKNFLSFKVIKKVLYFIVLIILIIIIADKFTKNKEILNPSSNLIKTKEIEEFSLAKFNWDGIAKYYKNGDTSKVNTFIKYEAEINATMDMEKFEESNIKVNKKNKKITIILPKFELQTAIVFKDGGNSLSFIPAGNKIEMKDIIKTCEEDAIEKVKERVQILDVAKENAKRTIEGLLLPLVEDQKYTIVWEDGD